MMRPRVADPPAFRDAFSARAHGVTILTIHDETGRALGMTATAVCPVSAESLLTLACVDSSSRSHDLIHRAGRVGINLLAADQAAISRHCAANGRDKCLPPDLLDSYPDARTPVIAGTLVHLDCRVHAIHPAGTHSIIILAVERLAEGDPACPLIYFRRAYATIQPLPSADRAPNPAHASPPTHPQSLRPHTTMQKL